MRLVALLLLGLGLLGGCGYSLEMSRVEEIPEAPDPLTLLGRDLRQLKADHRVSIFDLKNEQKALEGRTKAEVKRRLASLGVQIQRDLKALEKKGEASLLSLRKRDADFGEQIAEMELQLRLMGGSIEEEINRYKDDSEQINDQALRELGNINRRLADDAKAKKTSMKMLQDQIQDQLNEEKQRREVLKKTFDQILLAQVKAEEQAREGLQGQIRQIKATNVETSASSAEQIKAQNQQAEQIKTLNHQVDELIEKLLPAVNRLAERLDKQEEQSDALHRKIDIDALNRQLSALTDTIDVQRRSLEMLGNTLTSEVDKQKRLLQKTMERLQALEPK